MRKRIQPLAVAVMACLLVACNRQPTGEDGATADTAASHDAAPIGAQHDPAGQENPEAIAKAYYAALVKQYGQDYAACGPSERTLPKECDAARDIPGAKPGARSNVLLMLDASGSMAARIGGETKMAAAQDALIGFTRKLSESADVALRVYGHTGNNKESGKAESCAGTELLYPFQKLDAGKFETAIRSFQPTGWTPIAASLDAVAQDFAQASTKDGANVVYVVSDGIETCDADPVAAARKLHESDIDVVVNVIGFDVDAEAARQLEAVAKAGGGEYLQASDRDDLRAIFNQREAEARNRYTCVENTQRGAFDQTENAQRSRFNCLENKARAEFDNIENAVRSEYDAVEHSARSEYSAIELEARSGYNAVELDVRSDEDLEPDARYDRLSDARNRRDLTLRRAQAKRDNTLSLAQLKRDYALSEARIKRDGVIDPARLERDRVIDSARGLRDTELGRERFDRDERLEDARRERDAGTGEP